MSIMPAIASVASSTPSSPPDRVEGYKSALDREIGEIQEKIQQLIENRFSGIIQRANQIKVDINQLRYEVIALKTDLANLFQGKEITQDYKFQPRTEVEIEGFIKVVENIEILTLQLLDLKLKKFREDISNCHNLSDINKSINEIKEFFLTIK